MCCLYLTTSRILEITNSEKPMKAECKKPNEQQFIDVIN